MSDLYRHELNIVEERKVFGWILFVLGAVFILFAVFFFQDETTQAQMFENKPVTTQSTRQADTNNNKPVTKQEKITLLKKYYWVVLAVFGLSMIMIFIITISHRIAQSLQSRSLKSRAKTTFTDPWKESGQRFKIDQSEE